MDIVRTIADWILGTSTSLFPTVDRPALERALRAGITHLEIVIRRADDVDQLEPIVRTVNELGMIVHSVHLPYGRQIDPSSLDPTMRRKTVAYQADILRAVADWRPKVAVLHPSSEPIEPGEREARLEVCRDSLAQIAEAAHGAGILLCVECLPRTCLGNSSDEILRLQSGIDHLGVCCDVNHLFKEAPENFIERVGDRIQAVHISDNDGVDERHWVPGKGVIDWQAVLRALARIGYPGPCMFEARARSGEPPVQAEDLATWWTSIKSAVGSNS